jgi:hypothetical protein
MAVVPVAPILIWLRQLAFHRANDEALTSAAIRRLAKSAQGEMIVSRSGCAFEVSKADEFSFKTLLDAKR